MGRAQWLIATVAGALLVTSCTVGAREPREDPLQAFELTPDQYRARLIVAEEEVARCMKAQGFDYVPSLPAPVEGVAPATPEEAPAYGYGISTRPLEVPYGTERESAAMVEDLVEAAAYDEALYGDPGRASDADPPIGSTGLGGCYEEGYRKAFADLDRLVQEADPLLQDLTAAVEVDPRLVALEGEWRRCMAAAGFPFDSQDEALAMINDRFGAIVELRDMDGDPETDDLAFVYDPVELETLREQERAIAAADAACSEPLRRRAVEVWEEYEQRFAEEHPDLIDEARRVVGGG